MNMKNFPVLFPLLRTIGRNVSKLRTFFVVGLLVSFVSASAVQAIWPFDGIETKVEGDWFLNGSMAMSIKKGLVAFSQNGIVFATYAAVGKDSLRVKRAGLDIILTVEFPSTQEMIWNRKEGDRVAPLFRFTKAQR
ncbi:MAG: hypothetical protein NT105_19030 [Verrucomicrobia bacterium]|nr:hypothetical protein [Verrucomicrobiota bacterium]